MLLCHNALVVWHCYSAKVILKFRHKVFKFDGAKLLVDLVASLHSLGNADLERPLTIASILSTILITHQNVLTSTSNPESLLERDVNGNYVLRALTIVDSQLECHFLIYGKHIARRFNPHFDWLCRPATTETTRDHFYVLQGHCYGYGRNNIPAD